MADYEIIEEGVLAAASNSIDFTSIPTDFQHLEIGMKGRGGGVGTTAQEFYGFINNDQTAEYGENKFYYLQSGSPTYAQSFTGASTGFELGRTAAYYSQAGQFSGTKMWFPNYQLRSTMQPNFIYQSSCATGSGTNGGHVVVGAGSWTGTTAINQITLFYWALGGGSEFQIGTSYYLAGLKG